MDRRTRPSATTGATCSFATFRGADNNNQLHFIDLGNAGASDHHRADQADRRNARRRIHADRQLPDPRLPAIRQGRAEPPHHRDRSREPRARRLEGRRRRNSRTRSKTPRSSAGASSIHSLVDVQSRHPVVHARRRARRTTCRCRASARCRISTDGRINTTSGSRSARRCRRPRCIDTTSRRGSRMAFEAPRAADRRVAVRDARDVCDVQGRHARAVLSDLPRTGCRKTAATRRCSTDTAASRSACCPSIDPMCRRGSSWAACSCP